MWKRILRDVLIGVAGTAVLAAIIYSSPYLRTWTKRNIGGAVGRGGASNVEVEHARIADKKLYADSPPLTPVEDWPRWRGPRGDGISREEVSESAWSNGGPKVLWSADVGLGYSSPVASSGKVYLFSLIGQRGEGARSTEVLTAFDAATGRILWNAEGGPGYTDSYTGTRSTPTTDGNHIFTYGGMGDLICRDVINGKIVWQLNVLKTLSAEGPDYGCASNPLIDGDLLYVQGGKPKDESAAGGGTAIAVNKNTGTIAWISEAKTVAGYAMPVMIDAGGQRQLIIFAGDAVYGMDPATGRTLWKEMWETGSGVNSSTPVYRDGRLFVTSDYGKGCMMMEISPAGEKKLWENTDIESRFPQTILEGDNLYANSEGVLKCMAWPDGKIRWQRRGPSDRVGLGGSLTRVAGGKLLLMTERGKIRIATASPTNFKVLAEKDLFDGEDIWSVPLVYGGRIYAKGQAEFVCLSAR